MTIKNDVNRIELVMLADLTLTERTRLGGMLTKLQSVRGVGLSKVDEAFLLAVENRLALRRGENPRASAPPPASPAQAAAPAKVDRYDTPECLRRENLPMHPPTPGGRPYIPGPSRFDRSRDE
jgi:hypothetical protein